MIRSDRSSFKWKFERKFERILSYIQCKWFFTGFSQDALEVSVDTLQVTWCAWKSDSEQLIDVNKKWQNIPNYLFLVMQALQVVITKGAATSNWISVYFLHADRISYDRSGKDENSNLVQKRLSWIPIMTVRNKNTVIQNFAPCTLQNPRSENSILKCFPLFRVLTTWLKYDLRRIYESNGQNGISAVDIEGFGRKKWAPVSDNSYWQKNFVSLGCCHRWT